MPTFIALLRGINVGGYKRFLKVEQQQMCDALRFQKSHIYLHTGNWIFTSEATAVAISKKIQTAIIEKYNWEVRVLVFKASQIVQIFNACPFSEVIKEKSYFTFLEKTPTPDAVTALEQYIFPDEEYQIKQQCVYFYPAKGTGRAKMSTNFFENKLKVTATSSNYKTMSKLCSFV